MKTKIIGGLAAIIVVGFLTGCATNPYQSFYHDHHKPGPFAPPAAEVDVVQIADAQFKETADGMKVAGWVCIGYSDFKYRGGVPVRELAIEQARRVQCDKVVLVSKVVGVQTMMAVPTLAPSQTYTTTETGNFNIGANYGSYSGAATTTTPMQVGVQYVPCDIPVYEVGASFWRRPQQ